MSGLSVSGLAVTRARAGALVGAFVLSLVAVLITPWCTRDRASADAYVDALRGAAARQLLAPGDVLVVHPPWRDDVVRAARAANVVPADVRITTALAPRHGEPLPPLVVLHDRGLALPPALARAVDDERRVRVGDLELVRMKRGANDGTAGGARDLTTALGQARVEVTTADGDVVACPWDPIRQRHACASLPEWMYVGGQELPVGGTRARCVWAHPISGGAVTIRWDSLPLDDRVTLDVALTDGAADNRAGAPVSIELVVDGESLGGVSTVPGKRGFTSRTFSSKPGGSSVELAVKTPNDGQRHACFRLTTGGAR